MCNGNAENGLTLLGKKLCSVCEEEIIRTNVYSSRYLYHMEIIRTMWFEYLGVPV